MRRFFQTIFKPFKQAWVWYLILLLVLSALVWFVGPLVSLTSAGWRLFIILILVVAWALNALRLQRKKLRQQQEADMGDQLPAKVDAGLLAKAIADLQGKYKKALQTVAQRNPWTLFITFRRNRLPWYLVLGSEGSGKTTMLTDSGLHFPLGNDALIDHKDRAEQLVQWRFAKDAVFIDTDGSLTTFTDKESLAGKVWQELLELMAWHRIRKAINGIILTVSMQELLASTTQQRQQLAHAIRSRLSEIEEELGVKYPVYVQLTKTDVLAGFNEFFETLTENERDQIWGITLPDDNKDVVHLFPEQFDDLINRLNQRLVPRLQETNDATQAALITMFASQLASTKSPISSFLNQVFETNHYQERGYLRGVYFTSCRQDTKPFNRTLLSDAKTLGIQQGNLDAHEVENKSYFIFNLFREVILQETHLLQMSSDQSRKMNLHRKTAYGVVAVVVLAILYFWTNSFILNNQKLTVMNKLAKNYLADYTAYYSGQSELPPSLSDLYTLRHTFKPDTDATQMHWGLYQGGRFAEQLNTLALRQLRRQFVPLLQQTMESELRKNLKKPSQEYNFLRAYLMLADPTHMDKQFVAAWMANYWQQTLPAQQVMQATLNESLQEYLNLDTQGIKANKALVAEARVKLNRTSPAERVYFELENEAAGNDVSISNEFDSDFSQVFGQAALSQTINILYTKQGYESIYKKNINSLVDSIADSNWILGRKDKASFTSDELASIKRHVATMYMYNYSQAWLKLLSKFKIDKFDNLSDADTVLSLLSQPTSPIKQILDQVYKNTTLEKGDANAAAVAKRKGKSLSRLAPRSASSAKSLFSAKGAARMAQKAARSAARSGAFTGGGNEKTTAVGAEFFALNTIVRSSHAQAKPGAKEAKGGEQSAYAGIQTALSNVDAYVQNIANAGNPNRAAYEAALIRMGAGKGGKANDPITKLIQIANQSPEPLKQWLLGVADNTWAIVLVQAKGFINSAWKSNVWPVYQQTLQYHYPLYQDARTDATFSDFTNFFAPAGVYDQFFQEYLQAFVNTKGARWTTINIDGSALPLSSYTLLQLQLAHQVQQSFFNNNKQISVPFSIRPINLTAQAGSVQLDVGGDSINYAHGPMQTSDLIWPAANPTQMASITMFSVAGAQQSINTNGDWAWLRLLDKAKINQAFGSNAITARFVVNNRSVTYSIEVKDRYNPFVMKTIHGLRLPETL